MKTMVTANKFAFNAINHAYKLLLPPFHGIGHNIYSNFLGKNQNLLAFLAQFLLLGTLKLMKVSLQSTIMSRTYDNWERLVAATLKREEFRQLALALSRETSFSSIQSDFTFDSPLNSDPDSSRVHSNTLDSVLDDPSYLNNGSINGSHVAAADGPLSPDIKHIALKELKTATKNLRFELRLGSGCGHIHKRWIDEHTLTAAKPGNVISAAVKKWNPISKQNRLELMV